ncbi:hypothetical protein Tco_0826587 [Tanacetum coccineum]
MHPKGRTIQRMESALYSACSVVLQSCALWLSTLMMFASLQDVTKTLKLRVFIDVPAAGYKTLTSFLGVIAYTFDLVCSANTLDLIKRADSHQAKDLVEKIQFRKISLTGFPAQSVRFSNAIALNSLYLLVLITGASQSRQHESRKPPTAELFDVDYRRISIVTVNTKEYHSNVLAIITRIMRRTL